MSAEFEQRDYDFDLDADHYIISSEMQLAEQREKFDERLMVSVLPILGGAGIHLSGIAFQNETIQVAGSLTLIAGATLSIASIFRYVRDRKQSFAPICLEQSEVYEGEEYRDYCWFDNEAFITPKIYN